MYAKLVNGFVQFSPRKIVNGDSTMYNPTEHVLLDMGYKPLQVDEIPDVPQGYRANPVYTDEGSIIHQTWELVKDTTVTSYEEELLNILLGEQE